MRHLWLLLVVALRLSAQPGVVISGPAMPPAAAPVPPSDLKPEDLGSIEGQVFNAVTGEPLNKANLTLTRADPTPGSTSPPTTYSTTSDATGRFVIRELEPARYRLRVMRNGFVSSEYGSKGPMRPGTTITVDRAKNLKGMELRLAPHGVITGRIVDEDGDPQAYVQVQLARIAYMQGRKQLIPNGGSSTNDLGEYRIFGLAPGKYFLSATYRSAYIMPNAIDQSPTARQDEDYVPTYYPGTTDLNAAVQVEVSGGAALSGINMKLAKARTTRIKGHVSQSLAPGRPTISVYVMPRRSDQLSMMMTMNRPRTADARVTSRLPA